jgi:hypothetical protein
VKSTTQITTNVLKDALTLHSFKDSKNDYEKMCESSKFASILIQHLKNASTLSHYLEKKNTKRQTFFLYDLIHVLYQVYMPLSLLKDSFTHYDLHDENVLLYEPIKGKHIRYHYHHEDGPTVTFCSPYIAKMIDYGSSFFNYDVMAKSNTLNPKDIYNKLCQEPKCNNSGVCGSSSGLKFFKKPYTKSSFFISLQMANKSHDLKLLFSIKNALSSVEEPKESQEKDMYEQITKGLLDRVIYGEGLTGQNKNFGTKKVV